MTKRQELDLLAETIAKLGPDSYLGPWLAGVAGDVEACIRSDFFPSVSIRETHETCEATLNNARQLAQDTVEQAQRTAKNIKAESERLVNSTLEHAITKIAAAKLR